MIFQLEMLQAPNWRLDGCTDGINRGLHIRGRRGSASMVYQGGSTRKAQLKEQPINSEYL